MKYTRLTKEQLEELHPEFITFLATQSITGDEWIKIKRQDPEAAEQQLDVFSDLIWDKVLSKTKYLQNSATQQLFLFHLSKEKMELIVVKTTAASVDLTSLEGVTWLQENIHNDLVELFTASKDYSDDRNMDIFKLIRQGADIVEGSMYTCIAKAIPS